MRVQFLDQEDPLEKEMAPHSSALAWKIPWTEGPGGCRPWGPELDVQRLKQQDGGAWGLPSVGPRVGRAATETAAFLYLEH